MSHIQDRGLAASQTAARPGADIVLNIVLITLKYVVWAILATSFGPQREAWAVGEEWDGVLKRR
jgi:hypothetical protein